MPNIFSLQARNIASYGLSFNKQEVLTTWWDRKTLCFSQSYCALEHFVMQINVNHQRLCVWGALSVLSCHKRYAHPLYELYSHLWFMSRLHLFFSILERHIGFNLAGWQPRPSFINSAEGALSMPSLTQNQASRKRALFLWKSTRGTISVV